MITLEQLQATSFKTRLEEREAHQRENNIIDTVFRKSDSVESRILTNEETNNLLKSKTPNLLQDAGVVVFSDRSRFFITDDSLFGYEILKNYGFYSCTHTIPSFPAARPGLEDGVIDTAEKLIFIFYAEEKQLTTTEQLLNYLNNYHDIKESENGLQ